MPGRGVRGGNLRWQATDQRTIDYHEPRPHGGLPVFAGTRVPVQTLIGYLEGGDSLDNFLLDFPSVGREHAIAVLEAAKSALLAKAAIT